MNRQLAPVPPARGSGACASPPQAVVTKVTRPVVPSPVAAVKRRDEYETPASAASACPDDDARFDPPDGVNVSSTPVGAAFATAANIASSIASPQSLSHTAEPILQTECCWGSGSGERRQNGARGDRIKREVTELNETSEKETRTKCTGS